MATSSRFPLDRERNRGHFSEAELDDLDRYGPRLEQLASSLSFLLPNSLTQREKHFVSFVRGEIPAAGRSELLWQRLVACEARFEQIRKLEEEKTDLEGTKRALLKRIDSLEHQLKEFKAPLEAEVASLKKNLKAAHSSLALLEGAKPREKGAPSHGTCPICKGTGALGNCERCSGTGRISYEA